jgi:predicted nucleic acid-binding protein
LIVLDCSVVMAWGCQEVGSAYADRVMAHLENETAIVPSLWPLEVGNALLMAELRKRIDEEETASILESLATQPIRVEAGFSLADFPLIGMLSREYKLTAYDAAYLELAMRTGFPLATLDKDLIRAAHQAKVTILEE